MKAVPWARSVARSALSADSATSMASWMKRRFGFMCLFGLMKAGCTKVGLEPLVEIHRAPGPVAESVTEIPMRLGPATPDEHLSPRPYCGSALARGRRVRGSDGRPTVGCGIVSSAVAVIKKGT